MRDSFSASEIPSHPPSLNRSPIVARTRLTRYSYYTFFLLPPPPSIDQTSFRIHSFVCFKPGCARFPRAFPIIQ